jgi:6-pyruvoyltetrahydropterin/6-carboxytetrahydropterin synthase
MDGLVRIKKLYRWEMGHRLMLHPGPCRNLHGHSYRAEIELVGTPDEQGMVLEFAEISAIMNPIVDQLDHSLMLHQEDPLIPDLSAHGMNIVAVSFHPTTEELGRWMLERFCQSADFPARIKQVGITVYETATSTVTLSKTLS